LPEHYREVIALARIAELPHREIAAQLGKTEEATRILLYRALAALAKAMGSSA
jgi:DNA-directed RNA polymerase specialized sigma24 family protein